MKFLKTLTASTLGSLIAFGVLLFFGFLFLIAFAAAGDAQPPVKNGSVLVLDLRGDISERVSGDPLMQLLLEEPAYDLHGLTRAIEAAADDYRIDAVWLRPSGVSMSWASLEAIRRSLETFSESDKPVYASSPGFYMNESEYFIASVADSVFLDPEAIFEFNGFSMGMSFYGGLLEKLDVDPIVVRAGNFKGAVEPYTRTSMSEENREQMQALLDGIEASFTSAVSESRNLSEESVRQLMDDDIMFSARDAMSSGLVDALMFNDEIRSSFNTRLGNEADEALTTVTMATYASQVRSTSGTDKIAVVHIDGTISPGRTEGGNPLLASSTAGSDTIVEALRRARERRGVKALIVRIDSPGGFAPAADAMLREIERTAEEMPVIISMGDLAASGGYWVATAGDYMIAEANTITGSIGVFSLFFDASGLLEGKLGVTSDQVSSGPSADMFSGLRTYSAGERAMLQRSTERTYQAFLEKVAESRGMSVEEVHEIAQGRVWTGSDALEVGLIDEIGGFDAAIRKAAQEALIDPEETQIVRYPRSPTLFEQMAMTSTVSLKWVGRILGAAQAPELSANMKHLKSLIQLEGTVQARFTPELTIQ